MTALKGREFMLYLGSGTSTPICGFRANTLSINNESVDVTDKCAAPYRTLLEDAGIRSMTISGEGFFDNIAAAKTLFGNALSNSINTYTLQSGSGEKFEGLFQITSFERSGEYNTEEQFSATLESSGQITYTP